MADTTSIRNALQPLQADTTALRETQSLQEHSAMIAWLSKIHSPAQQHDIISRRQDSTGQWFLDTAKFKTWLTGPEKTLFCPGIPGAGKTMMASIAIDHLCRKVSRESVGLAYFFCNYNSQADQNLSSLFAALLKQLVQSRPDIAAPVRRIYDEYLNQNRRPSNSEILVALQSVCLSYTTIFIVVDALDECTDRDGTRSRLIDELHNLQAKVDLRLLFTSRFIPEITLKFQSNPVLEIRASEDDVGRFVAGQISRLPKCIQRDEELRNTAQTKIVQAVDGM
jgi:NACHT domain